MSQFNRKPWASGPTELLSHAIHILKKDSDTNRRISLILIDNSIELSVRTFLSLPETNKELQIKRQDLNNILKDFSRMIEFLFETYGQKLIGIDLAIVLWIHRLRNLLYHEGNGLTIERGKVELYVEIAKSLLNVLFSVEMPLNKSYEMELRNELITSCARIEYYAEYTLLIVNPEWEEDPYYEHDDELGSLLSSLKSYFGNDELEKLREIFMARKNIIIGKDEYRQAELMAMAENVRNYVHKLEEKK